MMELLYLASHVIPTYIYASSISTFFPSTFFSLLFLLHAHFIIKS